MKLHQKKLSLGLMLIVLSTAVGAVFAARAWRVGKKDPAGAVNQRVAVRTGYPDRILTPRLTPQVRVLLAALGDRLSRRGKERATLIGTLNYAGSTQPVEIVHEFPNLFRIANNTGVMVSFNARAANQPLASDVQPMVESFFFDSAECFFISQVRGAAIRFLGARASLSESADGSVYDIYEVTDENAFRGPGQPRTKRYFFNSETQLLEIVRYEVDRNGVAVSVETRFTGWRELEGQRVPGNVLRFENGKLVFSCAINANGFSPRQSTKPGNTGGTLSTE